MRFRENARRYAGLCCARTHAHTHAHKLTETPLSECAGGHEASTVESHARDRERDRDERYEGAENGARNREEVARRWLAWVAVAVAAVAAVR